MIRKLATVGAIVTGVVVLVGRARVRTRRDRAGRRRRRERRRRRDAARPERGDGRRHGRRSSSCSPRTRSSRLRSPRQSNGWTATVQKNAAGEVTAITWTGGPLTGEDEIALPAQHRRRPGGRGHGRLQGAADLRRRHRRPLDRADPGRRRGAGAPGARAHGARRGGGPRRRGRRSRRLDRDSDSHDEQRRLDRRDRSRSSSASSSCSRSSASS